MTDNVQIIKADPQAKMNTSEAEARIRVAAYCRVSTDSEEQESSYEVQCAHYTSLISSNSSWTLAGIYADEGISGTSTKNRTEFKRMIADCENDLIDLVITKSISRWSRNTVDSLNNIRKLKSLDIPVYFEKESINTADANGEVLITILSSLAQQESDSISRNVRLGIQYHMQQGKRTFNSTRLIGYNEDGSINRSEADVVRRIFRLYLEGYSPDKIAERLGTDGIPSPSGKISWNPTSVLRILENEKYIGDFLMQKYYVKDFLDHKVVRNEGALPQYLIKNDHDPIVPRDVYASVQDEIQRRAYLKYTPSLLRMGSKEALVGRLQCSTCGRSLKKCTSPSFIDWRCRDRPYEKKTVNRKMKAKCTCPNVKDKEVKEIILRAFNELPKHRDELLIAIGRLDSELARVSEDHTPVDTSDGHTTPDDHTEENGKETDDAAMEKVLHRASFQNKIFQIRIALELIDQMEEKKSLFWKYRTPEEHAFPASCDSYEEFMTRTRYIAPEDVIGASGRIVEFDDAFIIRYLEKVVVGETSLTVRFKCGVEQRFPLLQAATRK